MLEVYAHAKLALNTERLVWVIKQYYGARPVKNVQNSFSIEKVNILKETVSIVDKTYQRNIWTPANVDIVHGSVQVSPYISICRRSQQLGISSTSLHGILKNELHLHFYKIQLTQKLKPTDRGKRRLFF